MYHIFFHLRLFKDFLRNNLRSTLTVPEHQKFPLCSCLEYSTHSPLPTCSLVNLSIHCPSLGYKDKISKDSSLYRGVRISQLHTKQWSDLALYRPRYQLRPTTSVQPVIRVRHSECLVIRRMLMTYGYHANTTLYDQSRTLTDGSVCFIISLHTGVQVVVRGIILTTVNKRTLFLPPPWIKEDFHMTQQKSEYYLE